MHGEVIAALKRLVGGAARAMRAAYLSARCHGPAPILVAAAAMPARTNFSNFGVAMHSPLLHKLTRDHNPVLSLSTFLVNCY
jgi:hypothetical protein